MEMRTKSITYFCLKNLNVKKTLFTPFVKMQLFTFEPYCSGGRTELKDRDRGIMEETLKRENKMFPSEIVRVCQVATSLAASSATAEKIFFSSSSENLAPLNDDTKEVEPSYHPLL